MSDKKKEFRCPLKFNNPNRADWGTQCDRSVCAWWVVYEKGGGHCAMTAIPFEIRKISDSLGHIEEWARCQP